MIGVVKSQLFYATSLRNDPGKTQCVGEGHIIPMQIGTFHPSANTGNDDIS